MKLKLVIDIDEELYNYIKSDVYDEHKDRRFDFKIRQSIKNAIPLPNGHGDLKDIETFKLTYGNDGAYYRFKDIIDAPTIIEADEE